MAIALCIIAALCVLWFFTSKAFDNALYRSCVELCLVSKNCDIVGQIYDFNSVLDEKYRITEDEHDAFIEIYKEYVEWLMSKYVDKNFRFRGEYNKDGFLIETMDRFLDGKRSNAIQGLIMFTKYDKKVVAYKLAYAARIHKYKYGNRYVEYAKNELEAAINDEI